jgi:hypothetical protein
LEIKGGEERKQKATATKQAEAINSRLGTFLNTLHPSAKQLVGAGRRTTTYHNQRE